MIRCQPCSWFYTLFGSLWNSQFSWWKWDVVPEMRSTILDFIIMALWELWTVEHFPPSGNCHSRKTADLCKRFRFFTDRHSFRHKLEAIDRHESRRSKWKFRQKNAIENGERYCKCCDKSEIKNCVNCQATCDRNWEQAFSDATPSGGVRSPLQH